MYVFATVPFAFLVGCGIGVGFSIVVSVRRAARGEQLRTRWLTGAGLLGGAALGAFVTDAPRDPPNAIARVLESVGLFSLIGAGTAGLAGWIIARASSSRPTLTFPVDPARLQPRR